MDATTCARILWATTATLSAGPGNETVLADARLALARMLNRGHRAGFSIPREPSPEERKSKGWLQCVDAALAAGEQDDAPAFALLWACDGAATPPTRPAKGHGLHWPEAEAESPRNVIGPLKDHAGRDVWLFLYGSIDEKFALEQDGDAEPGLFPRQNQDRRSSALAEISDTAEKPARAGAWSWVLFAAAVLLGTYAITWVYAAAEFTRGAADEILKGVTIDVVEVDEETPGQQKFKLKKNGVEISPQNNTCLLEIQSRIGNPARPFDRSACNSEWGAAWRLQKPRISRDSDWWDKTLAWFWKPTDVRGNLSLLLPLLTSALAILLIILAAGVAIRNYFLGALISEHNRISLSRLQQLAWTVVLFGGFTILGIFNMSILAGYVRDLAQRTALQDAGASGAAPIQEFWGFFPSMEPTLWAVLGITVLISPFLSKRILVAKDAKNNEIDFGAVEKRVIAPECLDQRGSAAHANLADLFTGEGEGNARQVDVSRLQHLVITGLLLSGYIVLLVEYVRTIDGTSILLAMLTGAPVFATMPPVDATFVGLLTISHAGYLAFKALPSAELE